MYTLDNKTDEQRELDVANFLVEFGHVLTRIVNGAKCDAVANLITEDGMIRLAPSTRAALVRIARKAVEQEAAHHAH